jgi:predicted nucleic acid-binding protein
MVVLDTNVISALMHEPPQPEVTTWLDRQPRVSVWTTSITIMEIRHGIESLAPGRRRTRLQLAMATLVAEKIEHRIAAFDTAAANAAAVLMAERQRAGRPGDMRDTMIAGIVIASHATLATRNTRHFADLSVAVVDPWQA